MRVISLRKTSTNTLNGSEESLEAVVQDGDKNHVVNLADGHPQWRLANEAIATYNASARDDAANEALAQALMRSTNLVQKVQDKLIKVNGILDGRMYVAGNRVTIDHEPIDPVLEAHIIRLLSEDGTPRDARNWKSFAKFVENTYANVSEHVRKQLFGWLNYENLTGRGFTLTDDGCFIGYKGCAGTEEEPVSVHHGPAIVDGVRVNGAVPNKVGSVIEMPRSDVQFDPAVGCASGLHVGTYDYASGWARGVLLTVKVNPRDVVSVPTECAAQKIRTCRYEVLETTKTAYTQATWGDDDDNDWDNYDEDALDAVDTEDDFQACSPQDVEEGDVVRINYRRQDGVTKSYTLTVSQVDNHYIDGELEDGGYRTFVKRSILSIARKNEQDEEEVQEEAAPEEDSSMKITPTRLEVSQGDTVELTYRKADGSTSAYTLTVEQVGEGFIAGRITEGGYRRFLIPNIVKLAMKGEEKAEASSEAPQPEAPLDALEQAVGQAVRGLVDKFFKN